MLISIIFSSGHTRTIALGAVVSPAWLYNAHGHCDEVCPWCNEPANIATWDNQRPCNIMRPCDLTPSSCGVLAGSGWKTKRNVGDSNSDMVTEVRAHRLLIIP